MELSPLFTFTLILHLKLGYPTAQPSSLSRVNPVSRIIVFTQDESSVKILTHYSTMDETTVKILTLPSSMDETTVKILTLPSSTDETTVKILTLPSSTVEGTIYFLMLLSTAARRAKKCKKMLLPPCAIPPKYDKIYAL